MWYAIGAVFLFVMSGIGTLCSVLLLAFLFDELYRKTAKIKDVAVVLVFEGIFVFVTWLCFSSAIDLLRTCLCK